MRKKRPEGMNDKMYRPEYDGPKVPAKGPMIPPRNPAMPAPQKPPMRPGSAPRPPMKVQPNQALSEDAKKAALEMMRKRSGR